MTFAQPIKVSVSALALIVTACGGEPASEAPAPAGPPQMPMGAEAAPHSPPAGQPPMARPGIRQGEAKRNEFWWPESLNLQPLRQNEAQSSPYGPDFNYAEEFLSLDLDQVKADIESLMTTSQDWWPADYGHYGPFFIRMAWHSAGTYRTTDGRGGAGGGQQRFEPLNSWPDNANLDKARRLLWPIKAKYGHKLSWADLMVLTGNVALESMGFETYGFAGGREDDWSAELVYWGPETTMLGDERYPGDGSREPAGPLAAVQMGLIYVNPEGPGGNHNPLDSARDIRETFGRMAMNDEETVALIAGGHTFGKMHGAHKPADCLEAEPGGAGLEEQGLGWKNNCGKGNAEDTVTSGLEGAWTQLPTKWTSLYLQNLLGFEWKQTRSPAGAIQWIPTDESLHKSVPDAHVEGKKNPPVMTTADLALKYDPEYRKIAERFLADPKEYQTAFAKAWFKLTHRDMGPKARYLGNDIPEENFIWQDPVPKADYKAISDKDVKKLKADILDSGLTVQQLVKTAWAAASSFRASDLRGGANGARIALEPQMNWEANEPETVQAVVSKLKEMQEDYNSRMFSKKKVSLADLIVIGGAAAIEKAAADAGVRVTVPVVPGRTDATQEQTDVNSFSLLEPTADAFRNYYNAEASYRSPTDMLVDKADQLNLTVPEMTVLLGGLRSLGANTGGTSHGVFTDKVGTLNNDFFVTLLDMGVKWRKTDNPSVYEGVNRTTGEVMYTGTPVDLVFGSNSELRAVAEVYAYDNAKSRFVKDFVDAWTKVMTLDRFDLRHDLNASLGK